MKYTYYIYYKGKLVDDITVEASEEYEALRDVSEIVMNERVQIECVHKEGGVHNEDSN